MSIARKFSALVLATATALVLGGCGERPQEAPLTSGEYLGKPDTRPWQGEPVAFETGAFKRGDKASWEAALKERGNGQNEFFRIR